MVESLVMSEPLIFADREREAVDRAITCRRYVRRSFLDEPLPDVCPKKADCRYEYPVRKPHLSCELL